MGIFDDAELPPDFAQERPVAVWVDTHLANRNDILAWLIAEGGTIIADMDSPSTNHLILSPASQGIFDSFCHPDWIPLKLARVREARKETWDVWRGKVLLKSKWVGLCQREGRYLGEADSWANCRVGGPRIVHRSSISPLKSNIFAPPLDPQDLLLHIYPPISPPISHAAAKTRVTDLPAPGDHDMDRDSRGLQERATETQAHRVTEQEHNEEADMELDMELDVDEDASDAADGPMKSANREVVVHQDAEAGMEVDMDIDMESGTAPGTQSQIAMTESHPPVPAIPAGLSSSEPPCSPVTSAIPTAHHSNATLDLALSTHMTGSSGSPLRKPWTPYETPELIENTSVRSSGSTVQVAQPVQSPQRPTSVQPRIPSDTGVGPSVPHSGGRVTGAAPSSVPAEGHGGVEAGHSRSATTEITLSASGRDPHVHQVDAEDEETAWNDGELVPAPCSLPVASSSESIAKGAGSGQAAFAADAGKVMDKEGRTEPADDKKAEKQRFGVPATMSDRRGLVSRIKSVTPAKYPPRPTPSLPVRPSAAAVTATEQTLVSGSVPVLPVSGASALIPPPNAPKGPDKHSAMLAAQQESIRLGRQRSTVFRGCNVMLQKGKYGRNTYMKLIRQGSGMATDNFMTHNPKTTHVLCDETEFSIIPFPNIQWNVFKQAGVAIVNYNWLMDSARSGRLMPTENYPPKRRQDMPSVSKYATAAITAVQRGESGQMTASSSTSMPAHTSAETADPLTETDTQITTEQTQSNARPAGDKSRSSMAASSSASQADGKRAPRDALPTRRLVEIFKTVPKGTQPDMKALQIQYGHYKISHWTSLWYQYRNRSERFRHTTRSDAGEDDAHVYGDDSHEDYENDREDEDDDMDADGSEESDHGAEDGSLRNCLRPAIGTRLVKKRNPMPLAQLVDIFSSVPEGQRPDYDELAEKYPYYPRSTWSALWSKFKHRTHRFSNVPIDPSKGLYAFPRNLPGVAADEDSDDDASDGDDEDTGREIPLRKTSKVARNALSTEKLVELFRPLPTHIAPNYKKLNQQYPCYSISTWSALWSNWKSRKQRFANILLDVGARSALANGQDDGAISDHRQGGSGGHSTGEAADAGEDLSAAELEAIFGNEALQNVSFADRMAIYQAQMPEQPFFVVKGLCADYQSGQGIFQGRAQPPDASVPSTFTDVGDAIHHTPAPRTATPGKQFIPRMLEIFNERYPEDVRLGRTVHAAAAAMTAAHGVYTQGSWANFYSEWKHGSGKFTGYGERSPAGSRAERASEAAPPRSAKGKLPLMSTARTLEIFSARYEDDAKSGASYRDIGLDLWDTHRAYGANTWATFYGEWMQGKGRYEGFGPRANSVPAHLAHKHPSAASTTAKSSAEGPPGHRQQSTTSDAALDPARPQISAQSTDRFGGPPTKASLLRAKLFKGMEDAIRRNPREAANKLGRDEKYAAYGGYDASTWIRMMTSWTNGSAQFKNLPDQLQYGYREVLESPSAANQSDVPSSLLQATSSGPSLSPEKRARDDASVPTCLRPSPSPAPSHRSQRSTIVVEIPRASPHPSPMRPVPIRSAFSPSMSTAREPSASPSKRARTDSHLAPSVPPDSRAKLRAASSPGSHSPTKRTATSDSSRPSKRQVRNMYTESEEAEMAVYVSRRLPRITEASLVDWKPFTDEHTARTPEAWVEHYRHYRCRIEALVQKLGGKIPGKRRPGQKRSHDDSDSEVEYIDGEPRARNNRPGGTKGQEIIIIDSDDD